MVPPASGKVAASENRNANQINAYQGHPNDHTAISVIYVTALYGGETAGSNL
jgi:hypothetical protein